MIVRPLSLFLFLITLSCFNPTHETTKAVLVIHGGAGWISKESVSDSMEKKYTETLGEALIKAKTTKTSSVISKGNGFGTPKTRKLENIK